MKADLTQRQNDAYEFIRTFMRTQRKPPTLKEIGDHLGIRSSNGVFKLLKVLEEKGYIARDKNAARAIRLLDADDDPYALEDRIPSLPVARPASSEAPEKLRQRTRQYLTIDPQLLRRVREEDACIIGRAGDDGMSNEGIRKGDYIIIEELHWEDLRNSDLVAALVGERMLVRRYRYVNARVHLNAANRHYDEESFPPVSPECFLIGRVVCLIRQL